ncbi:MAG: glycosyltransferase family 4 protein [Agriterribacter sp.]
MRIALITDGIWPYVVGGMQKHSYYLCKYFANNHTEVLLVHTAARYNREIQQLSCFSNEEKKFITPVFVEKPVVSRFPGHYIYQSWLYSKKIYETLGGFPQTDFVIAKGMTGWYFLKKKTPSSPPVGINIHGYEFMQHKTGFKMQLEALMLRFPLTWINRHADYVFSYGGRVSELIRRLGVPAQKIIEAPSAVEPEWMNSKNTEAHRPLRFLFIGRYERRKGIEEINRVLEKITGVGTDFAFDFVGPVPEDKRLRLSNVCYHGKIIDKNKMKAVLATSDVLVCPSYAEGMPNVILEGLANGCAVIATDVGAVPVMVNADNGWLIPAADIAALKKAMLDAIQMPEAALSIKKRNAYKTVAENFIWANVSKQLLNSISECVKK